jgi:sugar/nucleoside kinase (ribokinase family)
MFASKKNQPLITCLGSTSLDLFFPTDEGVIIETPEDVLSQKKIAFELGGKILADELHVDVGGVAANVSQGLSLLGVTARCYSTIGNDDNGKFCLQTLKGNGVDTSLINVLSDSRTDISAIIVFTPASERTIIHNRDSNKRLVVAKEKLETPWVFISALNGAWQRNIETVLEAEAQKNFCLAVNPGQHNLKEDPRLILRLVSKAEILILNKDEAIELVLAKNPAVERKEIENEIFLCQTLLSVGVTTVAITDGARGAWCANKDAVWFVAAPESTPVVDSTGAGDAFTSGFLAAFIQKKEIDQGLRWGMANSQAVISSYGAGKALIEGDAIEKAVLHIIPQKIA